ncbi:flagellar basal body-associated protein FliL [Thiomicrorhabdus sp. 6S3-12]|uniref:flagellar basal body-associated FliL family protein n=1 Tax=Thiomicrorhabdus sp. 6S3-12 TaxID=2819681 RepID=UPI001AADB675|nr:flagellar basal body-associated FliL family protein [Thiomicrorhabdus sp. 6S3-12]MBO1922927.1 flagellar basal body-associated FliL family protein [Thiomicrorhabdus sp. 6S3-12]
MNRKLLTLLIATLLSVPTALPANAEEQETLSYSPKYKQFDAPEEKIPKYFSMEKNVVNFRGEGKAKFLAVDLKFMSYYPQLVEVEMEHLRPILKNDVDRVLRGQTYSDLKTPDGPDQLREELLNTARSILEKHNLYPGLLEDVYLERFVMQ